MQQSRIDLPERYAILDSLGEGGGGSVFRVKDKFTDRTVALKLFSPAGDVPTDEDAFRNEFLLTVSLNHPNLMAAYDYGYDAGNHPFFTAELVDGSRIDSEVALRDKNTFLDLLGQICAGLRHLHIFGYSHNDLKPENILIDLHERKPVAKILDFGLARRYDPTHAKKMSGTVEYMAPEIFKSEAPTSGSDIYTLGVILYELVTGHKPYESDDPLEVISGHIEGRLPPIEPRVGFFGEDCIRILSGMLAKTPSERPENISRVFNSFARALGAETSRVGDDQLICAFESSINLLISRSEYLDDILSNRETEFRVLCTDSVIADSTARFLMARLQTMFVNVRIDGNDLSMTSVHAKETVDIATVDCRDSFDTCGSRIVNIHNYGRIPDDLTGATILEGDRLIPAALETILRTDKESVRHRDAVVELCGGDCALAKATLAQLWRDGVITDDDIGFRITSDPANNLPQSISSIVTEDLSFLNNDELTALTGLSLFTHDFSEQLATAILTELHCDAPNMLTNLVSYRTLIEQGDRYSFRHPVMQKVLNARLESEIRRSLHLIAARQIESDNDLEDTVRTGRVGYHLLCAGELQKSIGYVVEYQKMLADKGEFVEPEALLASCEQAAMTDSSIDDGSRSELLMAFGDLLKNQGRFDEAADRYRQITELPGVEPRLLAETYKDLGDIYKSQVDFTSGLRVLEKALKIYGELDDRLEVSHTLNNMGNMYWINSQYDFALDKYQQALEIQEELDAVKDIASTLSNIGTTYYIKGAHHTAIEYYERSIELKKIINDEPEIARTYNNMAAAYLRIQQAGRALNYLNRSMAINRRIGAQKELMFNLENTVEVCMGLGEFKRSEELAAEGLASARRLDDSPHVGIFSYWLGLLYGERGLLGQSLRYLEKSEEIGDSISDKSFSARTQLALAHNYIQMNSLDRVGSCIAKARKVISPVDPSHELTYLKVISAREDFISGKDTGAILAKLDIAEKEAEKHDHYVELCEALLVRLDVTLAGGRIQAEDLEKLDKMTEVDQHTIYRSHLYFYLAVSSMRDTLFNEALSYFEQAQVMATAFEQRELLARINLYSGKVCIRQLEYEDAFFRLKQAGEIVKGIVADIGDIGLVRSYMSSPEKLELVEAVRHLAVKLG